ncbi:MAG: hypothetical protein U5N58_06130 [Actinomycetota bacterium]|nr:hypothetical protein [Actinomycetota bacterium]
MAGQDLCIISSDDPELYRSLFFNMGKVFVSIWRWFLKEFSTFYAVCRFGDDLGYKSSTILKPEDIRELIIPQYAQDFQSYSLLREAVFTPFLWEYLSGYG